MSKNTRKMEDKRIDKLIEALEGLKKTVKEQIEFQEKYLPIIATTIIASEIINKIKEKY